LKGKPKGPKIPYRLPQLLAAPLTATIYFVEGEKDADALAKLGFTATTASEGAGAKWPPELTPYCKDRHVVVLPDADKAGRAHGQKVAKVLDGVAASVKVVDLFPDRNDGSDVSDWLEDDRAGAKLAAWAAKAPLWEPSSFSDRDGDIASKDDDELITELAALPKLAYAKRRKDAAKELGITAGELDEIVAEARGEARETTPDLYEHWAIERWPEPVDGDALLRSITDCLARYVVTSLCRSIKQPQLRCGWSSLGCTSR
jgi:DNA primase